MCNDKDNYITLPKKEFDEIINCYKRLKKSINEINEIKEKIETLLLNNQISYKDKPVKKIPGGGKIILMNGEFRKVFGALLKAIQKKYGNKIYFFSQDEYENLAGKTRPELSKDKRNIIWEHKNYHAKKKEENKRLYLNEIIKKNNLKFIRKNKRLKYNQIKLKNVSKYIDLYALINSKIKALIALLNSEKRYPYCSKKNQYMPIPDDIHSFTFSEKEKRKFYHKSATKNWTELELYFMNLTKYYLKIIPNQVETPGIPYITDEVAIKILKSNIHINNQFLDKLNILINDYIQSRIQEFFEFFINLSNIIKLDKLNRDDYFALSKILNIPIFDFNSKVLSVINSIKLQHKSKTSKFHAC